LKRLRPFAFLPAAFVLAYLIHQHGISSLHWDEWGCEAPFLRAYLEGSLSPKVWLAQCNESRPAIPKLIWLFLTLLAGVADPRWSMFTGWLIVCLTCWNLHRLAPSSSGAGFLFVASALLFSPLQLENWLWGAQMMLFIPAFLLTIWLRIARDKEQRRVIAWGCLLALLATFSFANGVLLWPALFGSLPFLAPALRSQAKRVWIIAFGATLAVYLYGFVSVASSPSYTAIIESPRKALQYFLTFLGGPLAAGEIQYAWIAGRSLLVLLLGFLATSRNSLDSLPWAILAGYALTSAGLATIGRVALGPQQALDSRYGAFAVWLPIAVLGLVWQSPYHRAWRTLLALLLFSAHVPSSLRGLHDMHYRTLAGRYQRACLTFLNALPPGGGCNGNYPVWSADFLREASAPLDRAGWIVPKLFGPADTVPRTVGQGVGNIEAIEIGSKWRFQGGAGGDPDAIVLALEVADQGFKPIALTEAVRTVVLEKSPSAWRTEIEQERIPPGSRVAAFAYRAEEPRWLQIGVQFAHRNVRQSSAARSADGTLAREEPGIEKRRSKPE
jgi:hypothetical protein